MMSVPRSRRSRVAFSYGAFGLFDSAVLAVGTVFGTGTALVFNLAVFLARRRQMGFSARSNV